MTVSATLPPADRLRAAATLLRQRATAATPGPWQTADSWAGPNTVLTSEGHPIAICGDGSSAAADQQYIATMHPGVGLALAHLLNNIANVYDAVFNEIADDPSHPIGPATLRLADAILRTTEAGTR